MSPWKITGWALIGIIPAVFYVEAGSTVALFAALNVIILFVSLFLMMGGVSESGQP